MTEIVSDVELELNVFSFFPLRNKFGLQEKSRKYEKKAVACSKIVDTKLQF